MIPSWMKCRACWYDRTINRLYWWALCNGFAWDDSKLRPRHFHMPRVDPKLLVAFKELMYQIVSVQPMTAESGLIFELVYGWDWEFLAAEELYRKNQVWRQINGFDK